MILQFWGVRGSIPAPGPDTVRYGGNTSCVSIDLDPHHTLVLDAGTGLRELGKRPFDGPHTFLILLSHLHWDHIQGIPLFAPNMDPEATIRFLSPVDPDWGQQALSQFNGRHFPLSREDLRAEITIDPSPVSDVLAPFGVEIESIRLNHEGYCLGYRLRAEANSIVYMTDNELGCPERAVTSREKLVSFCTGADILIHDAQYIASDLPRKLGWGHSTVEHVCRFAIDAGVSRLVLFHHDPDRSDQEMDGIIAHAHSLLRRNRPPFDCSAAFEGLQFDLRASLQE